MILKAISTIVAAGVAALIAKFHPAELLPIILRKFVNHKLVSNKIELQLIEGIHLPDNIPFSQKFKNVFDLNYRTNIDVVKALATGTRFLDSANVKSLENKPKSEDPSNIWPRLQQSVINDMIKVDVNDPPPVPGYLYFGDNDFVKILSLLCKENPFFVTSLTAGTGTTYYGMSYEYLELVSFSTTNSAGEEPTSKFYQYMQEMGPEHYINVRFDLDMQVSQITYYDEESKTEVLAPKDKWNYYASGALYNQLYFATAIHATIHIFHYIMTSAIQHVTKHSTPFNVWAELYDDNIALKYIQVSLLLIDPKVGDVLEKISVFNKSPDDYVLTGKEGFGANSGKIIPYLKREFTTWGQSKSVEDFVENFLLKDLYDSPNGREIKEKANLLSEYSKHQSIVRPFAEELSAAMKESDPGAFRTAETELKEFMSECGDTNMAIDTISSWVQLMSITGILHGSTLSYTRLVIMPDILRWRKISAPEWSEKDIALANTVVATLQGMEVGRHVFTSDLPNNFQFVLIPKELKTWETDKMHPKVLDVVEKYDGIAQELKETSKKSLLEDPEYFRRYGWMLSDWCPDGYDGKQMTIAAYI